MPTTPPPVKIPERCVGVLISPKYECGVLDEAVNVTSTKKGFVQKRTGTFKNEVREQGKKKKRERKSHKLEGIWGGGYQSASTY